MTNDCLKNSCSHSIYLFTQELVYAKYRHAYYKFLSLHMHVAGTPLPKPVRSKNTFKSW